MGGDPRQARCDGGDDGGRLFADKPGSRDLFDHSAGYAVFDKREASFYVVAGYGRGVAVDAKTGSHVYMKMATTGAGMGFGLGGFASQLVILFEDGAAFQRFVAEGLDATAEVGTMAGEEKERLALGFLDEQLSERMSQVCAGASFA